MTVKKKIIAAVSAALGAAALLAGGLGFIITPVTGTFPDTAVEGVKPFAAGTGVGSNYYRIPAVLTTQDGSVLAAIDARFGGTFDSPNNLDTAVSRSEDHGKTWSPSQLALSFQDWVDSRLILKEGAQAAQNSASAIDPSLLQDLETGRVFALVDAFPHGIGIKNVQQGSGYTEIDGQKYLMLRKKGESEYSYTARENGIIYDASGKKTAYSLNDRYEVLENGRPLSVEQKEVHYWYTVPYGTGNGVEVPMNILYQDSLFQPLPTSYLYLISSDDNGITWSAPVNLNGQVKPDTESFMGVGPGRGIQIQNGAYAGRLIFTAYYHDPETSSERFTTLYSDDHGGTWKAGDGVTLDPAIGNMSETQLVELPDGSLQSFSRTTVGHVATARSTDGGVTWSAPELVEELPLTTGGCQVSAINYQGEIDGCNAVLLSAPAGENRTNGYIYVGLIRNDGQIDWTYRMEVTPPGTYFAYSCLTQLADGSIGLLYEQANTSHTVDTVVFKTYTVRDLCAERI